MPPIVNKDDYKMAITIKEKSTLKKKIKKNTEKKKTKKNIIEKKTNAYYRINKDEHIIKKINRNTL